MWGFGHTDTHAGIDPDPDAACTNTNPAPANADTACTNADASCANADASCANPNTACADANSVACTKLYALNQPGVGESSAHGRNRHLYRDDYAHERIQCASFLHCCRASVRSCSDFHSESGFG